MSPHVRGCAVSLPSEGATASLGAAQRETF